MDRPRPRPPVRSRGSTSPRPAQQRYNRYLPISVNLLLNQLDDSEDEGVSLDDDVEVPHSSRRQDSHNSPQEEPPQEGPHTPRRRREEDGEEERSPIRRPRRSPDEEEDDEEDFHDALPHDDTDRHSIPQFLLEMQRCFMEIHTQRNRSVQDRMETEASEEGAAASGSTENGQRGEDDEGRSSDTSLSTSSEEVNVADEAHNGIPIAGRQRCQSSTSVSTSYTSGVGTCSSSEDPREMGLIEELEGEQRDSSDSPTSNNNLSLTSEDEDMPLDILTYRKPYKLCRKHRPAKAAKNASTSTDKEMIEEEPGASYKTYMIEKVTSLPIPVPLKSFLVYYRA